MPNQVIFNGTPSQVINIPAFLKGSMVLALIGVIHIYASDRIPFQTHVLLAQAAAVLMGVGLSFLKTAFTKITIDTEQITWKQGMLRRRIATLELSRIQTITTLRPWWQRPFGTGSVIIVTDDPSHPLRRLPGIRNAEQLRSTLGKASAVRGFKTETLAPA